MGYAFLKPDYVEENSGNVHAFEAIKEKDCAPRITSAASICHKATVIPENIKGKYFDSSKEAIEHISKLQDAFCGTCASVFCKDE